MSGSAAGKAYAVRAACIRGVEAYPVTVEVSMAGGVPGMSIVGMADAAVLEARSRIRCALRMAGYEIPRQSLTVSLAPADIRKTGSGLDLPIAVAVLAVSGQIPTAGLDGCVFAGELSLTGHVSAARGEVAYQLLAREHGLAFVGGLGGERIPIEGVERGYLPDLAALRQGLASVRREVGAPAPAAPVEAGGSGLDFGDVIGQEIAKRAISVAAAGGLGMLMVGAPGSGKSMLARRMPGILPPVDAVEQQEALCIHSVAGEPVEALLRGERPFRSPHHSISTAGLVGGGRPVRPGEISLAHCGICYLDELAEFRASTLQALRQPLEQGCVRIVRADGAYAFPARFQLLAASNPCPCGYLGDREIACRCSETAIERYQSKLGGPLADRIDIILDVARPDPELIVQGAEGLTTAQLREQVARGHAFRSWRETRCEEGAGLGPRPSAERAVESFELDDDARETLLTLAHAKHLTGRGIARLCRIARTLADMEEAEAVAPVHVMEGSVLQGRRGDERS